MLLGSRASDRTFDGPSQHHYTGRNITIVRDNLNLDKDLDSAATALKATRHLHLARMLEFDTVSFSRGAGSCIISIVISIKLRGCSGRCRRADRESTAVAQDLEDCYSTGPARLSGISCVRRQTSGGEHTRSQLQFRAIPSEVCKTEPHTYSRHTTRTTYLRHRIRLTTRSA
jgi:hypothetical protein